MPCLETGIVIMDEFYTPEALKEELRVGTVPLLLDCRPQCEYSRHHIVTAISISLPALLKKRLKSGTLNVLSIIHNNDAKEQFQRHWKTHTVVLYDDCCTDLESNPCSVLNLLLQKLRTEGCTVYFLLGGYTTFEQRFPEYINAHETEDAILGLRNLSLSDDSAYGTSDSDSENSPANISPFPVKVLPHLFLGNARNSADLSQLKQYGIKYILNVTPNVPNQFEKDKTFKYMQIPINDHWSQNLSIFFPEAIAFIDEARVSKCGVLVHCFAGISRSVTVTVAYLMQKKAMTLNEAYDYVKKCKPNISPNFNFMGQLLDFEKTLSTNNRILSCDNDNNIDTNHEVHSDSLLRSSGETESSNCAGVRSPNYGSKIRTS